MSVNQYKFFCPSCIIPIPPYNVNMQADELKCDNCGGHFKASELMAEREKLAQKTDPNSIPDGASISLWHVDDDVEEVLLPATGFTSKHYLLVPFVALWFIAVLVTSVIMLIQMGWLVVIMVPFLLAGVSLCLATIDGLIMTEKLRVGAEGISITTEMLTHVEQTSFALSDISDVLLVTHAPDSAKALSFSYFRTLRNPNGYHKYTDPTLTSSKGAFYFFQRASFAEKKWIVDYLSSRVRKYKSVQ